MVDRCSWAASQLRPGPHDRITGGLGFSREARATIVSQELGHFRPEIVNEYLR